VAARIFSLPMHPYLEQADQERIIGIIQDAVAQVRGAKKS